jgi:uncharacterized protein DUF932
MMVSEGEFSQVSVRHTGGADGVINATYEVVEQFPRMIESAAQFGHLRLTEPERNAYARNVVEQRRGGQTAFL